MRKVPVVSKSIRIDIWSDIACPWCYIGKRRLESALATLGQGDDAPDVSIEYHSFELMPDMPRDYAGTHDAFLSARMGWPPEKVKASNQHLAQLGAPLGLDYRTDLIRMTNTVKAHQLLHYAKAHGKQVEMKERLLRAYFTDGRHVGEISELADLAAEIGLDRTDVKRSLDADEYRDAVEADKDLAVRHGIRGVPFFVVDGKYGLSGAQEPTTFLQALTKAVSDRRNAA